MHGGTTVDTIPNATLKSIWDTLSEREHAVLRAMAESVRPNTDVELAEYLSGKLNYNNVQKALKKLRIPNLIVVKGRNSQTTLLELS